MDRASVDRWHQRLSRGLLAGLSAAGLSLLPACAPLQPAAPTLRRVAGGAVGGAEQAQPPGSAAAVEEARPGQSAAAVPPGPIIRATKPTSYLPAPAPPSASPPNLAGDTERGAAPTHFVPIGLDTVFRLAEEQNAQIALARERLREAYAEQDLAGAKWLPDVYVGTAYYRHEGGIQNEDGTLTHSSTGALFAGLEIDSRLDLKEVAYQRVNAERQVWQQKGQLSKVTSETLLEAANTYIDLLTARTAEAIARDLEKDLKDLLGRAQKLAEKEKAAQVEVARIQAELSSEQQSVLKLGQQAGAASAKLIYLLGLDPGGELLPVDRRLVAFELIDATPLTGELVAQALSTGPGVQEMEGLLALIQDNIERSQGPGKYVPIFEMRMAEGGFGAGPGDRMVWDNRWDLGLQARWNLTEFLTARDRRRVALAKMQQAQLAYQDLRGKLTAGVQEARDAILSGGQQIRHTEEQVRQARRAYDLGELRLKTNPQPTSYSEVLLAVGGLARAQLNYLTVTSAYDKAQVRLLVLLGPGAIGGPHAPDCHD